MTYTKGTALIVWNIAAKPIVTRKTATRGHCSTLSQKPAVADAVEEDWSGPAPDCEMFIDDMLASRLSITQPQSEKVGSCEWVSEWERIGVIRIITMWDQSKILIYIWFFTSKINNIDWWLLSFTLLQNTRTHSRACMHVPRQKTNNRKLWWSYAFMGPHPFIVKQGYRYILTILL